MPKFTLKKRFTSPKDYSFHKSHRLGALSFPDSLLFLSPILNQDSEDCTAFAAVATRDSETNLTFDPQQFWADEMAFAGDDGSKGYDLGVPAAVGVKTGFVPMGTVDRGNKASSYFWVTKGNGNDLFDNMRLAILTYQRPLMAGLDWYTEYDTPNGVMFDNGKTLLGGHCIKVAGFLTLNGIDYLVIQQSWGPQFGNQGLFYVPRSLANKIFTSYGVFYWSDDKNAVGVKMGLLQALLQNVISLYQTLFSQKAAFPPKVSLLPNLVQGIFEAEGGGKQAGVQYNNWGDIRGHAGNKYIASLGATGYGENNLAIFPTKEIGDQACLQLVTDVANNLLLAYPKPCTIREFVKIYGDPTTQLEWDNYTSILCKHTGKAETTTLTQLK